MNLLETKKKICVVDDSEDFAEILCALLRMYVKEVDAYHSLSQICSKIPLISYDLIFVDYNVGHYQQLENGVDFLRKIYSEGFQGHCVLCSGDPDLAHQKFSGFPLESILIKPFNQRDLENILLKHKIISLK